MRARGTGRLQPRRPRVDIKGGTSVMSHVHSIDNQSSSAAQYQAFLDRLQAERAVERDARVRKKFPADPSRRRHSSDPQRQDDPGRDPESAREEEPEGDQGDGFGKHYA